MVGALAKGIAERNGKADEESTEALKAGVQALAEILGPVEGMFEEGTALIYDTLPLREDVKELPPRALKHLLASDELQLQLENEAYALLRAWLWQSSHSPDDVKFRQHYKKLAPLLRYHHMTTDFLANVVGQCSLMAKSGLLLSLMRSAIVYRGVPAFLLNDEDKGKRDRGEGDSDARWEIKASFTLEEVAALEPEEVQTWCGLVAGYPTYVRVKRCTQKDDTLGVYIGISLPGVPAGTDDLLTAGVGLRYDVTFSRSVDMEWETKYFRDGRGWGWSSNAFQKPWTDAVREGSPHFPGRKLKIEATLRFVTDDDEVYNW